MGAGRTISQEAFEEVVKENIDDLDMDPDEALQDAIETLTLQGVDLSGIVKCIPGVTSASDNPVIRLLEDLKISDTGSMDDDGKAVLLDQLLVLCSCDSKKSSEFTSVAVRNGGIAILCSLCSGLHGRGSEKSLVLALCNLHTLLKDIQSTEDFRNCDGPKIIVDVLKESSHDIKQLDSGFSVVAAAATGNEVVKELFMDLKIDEFILETMKGPLKGHIQSLYDAVRVLLTPDDNRVLVSQVFGYSRRFFKIGVANVLVDAIHDNLRSNCLVSICIALRAVSVNDEICRSISEYGGIDATLICIDDSGEIGNKAMAKACCSLLSKLAGSDSNKNAIVQKGGLDRLIKLSSRFSDDPSVLQEIMSIICTLSLRSPENAARAVEAGVGDMAILAMQKFTSAYQMQKQCCLMIRNLVVRNVENRSILLGLGIEKLIRRAKSSHESCNDAASAALRDFGFDDYK
ncbi:putative Armadillo repeat-containing protein [Zostera marina]|uniref:Putative Armadillo repeat-containing protein n=1 Tax=Zostera marina TaxID=29655 RepID=A0A0K9PWM0_ZOSMR|nr:putative Armadillo repeat-containing protein [Zostera marina]